MKHLGGLEGEGLNLVEYPLARTEHGRAIYQFYKSRSRLTTQVLYKLKSQSTTAFHYVPEIDLWGYPEPDRKREMHIACVADGKIIIVSRTAFSIELASVPKAEVLTSMICTTIEGRLTEWHSRCNWLLSAFACPTEQRVRGRSWSY